MPSSRMRPQPGPGGQKRPSSRRPAIAPRGVSGREREDLLAEPPEYQSSEKLDTIGLEHGSGRPGSSRKFTGSSSRRESESLGTQSRRAKQEWMRSKLRLVKPVLLGIAVLIAIGIACYIPLSARNKMLAQLHHGEPYVRENAAINLGERHSGLDQLYAKVQGGAPDGFEGPAGAAALGLAWAGEDGFSRLKALAGSQNPVARRSAAYGLGLTGRPDTVELLVTLLADQDGAVKLQAAKALGRIRAAGASKALLAQADSEMSIREAAIAGLLTSACADARPELIKGLTAPTAEMRQAAGRALILIDQIPSDTELKDLVGSKDPSVKAGAIEFLGLIGGAVFDEIIPQCLEDKAPEVRRAAAAAAGLRRWDKGTASLEKLVAAKEANAEVRQAAAEALGQIGKLESVVPLAKAVVDIGLTEKARIAAAKALITIGNAWPVETMHAKGEVNDYLTHLKLAAKSPDVRWAALEILAGGCDSFAGDLADPAFNAMGALARRDRAKKADVWKDWMAKKLDEAKALGQASYIFDRGYALGKRGQNFWNQAIETMRPAYKIVKELREKCEPDDKEFYETLIRDMRQTYNEDEPKPKSKAPEAKPGEKAKIEEPKL